jgi:hypothetical protein
VRKVFHSQQQLQQKSNKQIGERKAKSKEVDHYHTKKKDCHERRDGMRCVAKGTRTLNLKVEKKTKTFIFKDTH